MLQEDRVEGDCAMVMGELGRWSGERVEATKSYVWERNSKREQWCGGGCAHTSIHVHTRPVRTCVCYACSKQSAAIHLLFCVTIGIGVVCVVNYRGK